MKTELKKQTKQKTEKKLFIADKLLKSKAIGNKMVFMAISYEELTEKEIEVIKDNLTGMLKINEHLITSMRGFLDISWQVFINEFWSTIEWMMLRDELPIHGDRDERDISILFRVVMRLYSEDKYPAFEFILRKTSMAPVSPIVMHAFTANGQAENVMLLPMDYMLIEEYQHGRMLGNGKLVQDLFPSDIYPSWMREYLISGLTPEQWIELFGSNDEDDEEEDFQHIEEIV